MPLSVVAGKLVCMEQVYLPPGWPQAVRPPGAPGFERSVIAWLFDLCPPEYRGYPQLRRYPQLLVRLTARLLAAQRNGTDSALAALRADMAGFVDPPAIEDGLRILRAEQQRLDRTILAVSLVERVLRGQVFTPRM